MTSSFSLTPNFSWVTVLAVLQNRFNGLFTAGKPLKRLNHSSFSHTRLKPGANEKKPPARPAARKSYIANRK